MMSKRMAAIAAGLILGALLATAGCGATPRAPAGDLAVAAASDLQFAFTDIGRLFEEETGARVTFVFGSSGNLAQQIENGAPIDLFASADEAYIDRLAGQGSIVPETRHLYALGRIALVSYRGRGLPVGRLEDLLNPEVKRVSIANPDHAPYGRAAREALQKVGLWDRVVPKIVYGENVRQALQFVQTGNAEAGIVALSIAEVPEVSSARVDGSLYQPLRQTMAVVKGSSRQDLAGRFVAFVSRPRGREIMEKYGFSPTKEGSDGGH